MNAFYKKHRLLFRLVYFAVIVWLILGAMTAFWLQRQFFDTQRFSDTATVALTSQSSRESIAAAVTERALENNAIVRVTVGTQVEGIVANALQTDVAQNTIRNTVERLQLLVTTPRQDPLIIDLTSVKAIVATGQTRVAETSPLAAFDVSTIPDTLTIVDTAKIPNVHQTTILVLWIGPMALILAAAGLMYWIHRGGNRFALHRYSIAGLVVAAAGLVAVIVGPLVRPGILSVADDASSQTLVGNLYDAFMNPFTAAGWVVFAAGLIIALSFAGLNALTRRYTVEVKVRKK